MSIYKKHIPYEVFKNLVEMEENREKIRKFHLINGIFGSDDIITLEKDYYENDDYSISKGNTYRYVYERFKNDNVLTHKSYFDKSFVETIGLVKNKSDLNKVRFNVQFIYH